MIRYRLLLPALVSVIAAAEAAPAQISREGGARIQNVPVRSEVTVDPLELQASLDGTVFRMPMRGVNLNGRMRPVLMVRQNGSTVGVWDAAPSRENGTYSVRFTLPWVNQASQLQIRTGGPQTPPLATCQLVQDVSYDAVEQHCEGTVNLTDGRLDVWLEFTIGHQAEVSRITVRRLL